MTTRLPLVITMDSLYIDDLPSRLSRIIELRQCMEHPIPEREEQERLLSYNTHGFGSWRLHDNYIEKCRYPNPHPEKNIAYYYERIAHKPLPDDVIQYFQMKEADIEHHTITFLQHEIYLVARTLAEAPSLNIDTAISLSLCALINFNYPDLPDNLKKTLVDLLSALEKKDPCYFDHTDTEGVLQMIFQLGSTKDRYLTPDEIKYLVDGIDEDENDPAVLYCRSDDIYKRRPYSACSELIRTLYI